MSKFNFGRGEYRYFDYPLPSVVRRLRAIFYERLAPVANRWDPSANWPACIDEMTRLCHEQGQTRPTPLLLRYGAGDYNCLHQDLYGDIRFPLQVVVLLSRPGLEFEGGELILVEQRPRRQSRSG